MVPQQKLTHSLKEIAFPQRLLDANYLILSIYKYKYLTTVICCDPLYA